jgi:hypothetical protein
MFGTNRPLPTGLVGIDSAEGYADRSAVLRQ